jgi:hypothetical protein
VILHTDFLSRISPEDIRFRFFAPRKSFLADALKCETQLDYDGEMAFVARKKKRARWQASAGCSPILSVVARIQLAGTH